MTSILTNNILIGILIGISLLSLMVWIVLVGFRGQFWRCNQILNLRPDSEDNSSVISSSLEIYPTICAIIPARNEAELLPQTLSSLLNQDYPGDFSIVLVDDNSTDDTYQIAQNLAAEQSKHQVEILTAQPLQPGWTGKLWALDQGIERLESDTSPPDYLLLTDADIQHDASNLTQLVHWAVTQDLDLVSLMVLLRCESFWEKLLIPAFVFFFQKLYPFSWVNHPQKRTAAAAGGCILIRRTSLAAIGGIASVRQALIDDCSLAQRVKFHQGRTAKIWLSLTDSNQSLRAYDSLESIWEMVARTAFTQLNYSVLMLLGTVLGMIIIYLVPPIAVMVGLFSRHLILLGISSLAWGSMIIAYRPTLNLYQKAYRFSPGLAILLNIALPFTALLYTGMTLDSARRYWQGKAGQWKGRTYESPEIQQ